MFRVITQICNSQEVFFPNISIEAKWWVYNMKHREYFVFPARMSSKVTLQEMTARDGRLVLISEAVPRNPGAQK